MKVSKIILLLLVSSLILISCVKEEIKENIMDDFEIVEYKLPEFGKVLEYYQNEIYYVHTPDISLNNGNILYKTTKEGDVEKIFQVDEEDKITSVLIHDEIIYFIIQNFKEVEENKAPKEVYSINKFENGEVEVLIEGVIDNILGTPQLSLIDAEVFVLLLGNFRDMYVSNDYEGVSLYNVSKMELVEQIVSLESQTSGKSMGFISNVGSLNNKMYFTHNERSDETPLAKSTIYRFDGKKLIKEVIENVWTDSIISFNDYIMYSVITEFSSNGKLNVGFAHNTDLKKIGTKEEEILHAYKVSEYKDGALVGLGLNQNLNTDDIYYVFMDDDGLIFEKVNLFEMDLHGSQMFPTPHGFCVSGAGFENVNIKCLKEK